MSKKEILETKKKLCKPMLALVEHLESKGLNLKNVQLIDPHFNDYEVVFKDLIKKTDLNGFTNDAIKIDEEKKILFCACHWSICKDLED